MTSCCRSLFVTHMNTWHGSGNPPLIRDLERPKASILRPCWLLLEASQPGIESREKGVKREDTPLTRLAWKLHRQRSLMLLRTSHVATLTQGMLRNVKDCVNIVEQQQVLLKLQSIIKTPIRIGKQKVSTISLNGSSWISLHSSTKHWHQLYYLCDVYRRFNECSWHVTYKYAFWLFWILLLYF